MTIRRFLQDCSGATAIEYSMIAVLIAVVIIAALRTLGGNLTTKYETVSSGFPQ